MQNTKKQKKTHRGACTALVAVLVFGVYVVMPTAHAEDLQFTVGSHNPTQRVHAKRAAQNVHVFDSTKDEALPKVDDDALIAQELAVAEEAVNEENNKDNALIQSYFEKLSEYMSMTKKLIAIVEELQLDVLDNKRKAEVKESIEEVIEQAEALESQLPEETSDDTEEVQEDDPTVDEESEEIEGSEADDAVGDDTLTILLNEQGFVNVRTQPNIDAEKTVGVRAGETYEYLSERYGWYEIALEDDATGWVSGVFAEVQ